MPTVGKNPAVFSDTIITALSGVIPFWIPQGHIIHDPFAGEGTKLGALCDLLGYTFSGTDLEEWVDQDPRVVVGDSTEGWTYPTGPHAIVTSPTYNNGVNDHFKPKDTSRRLTYRVRAGHPLHPNNTGRWSGRGSKKGEAEYWRITAEVVKQWPDLAIVNVKDSTRGGEIYPLTQMWMDLLVAEGYDCVLDTVSAPGWRYGTNHDVRHDEESIICARRRT